jgi:hypothetical protein
VYQGGDDGFYRKGVASPVPRFTDNGNGTVTDNLTGLMWAQNANQFGQLNWIAAISMCESYAVAGYSDWRLPNAKELQSLIAYQYYNPAVCNTGGTGQWTPGNPFVAVQSSAYYWTSTTFVSTPTWAWVVDLNSGGLSLYTKTNVLWVWPVRGGP